MGEAAKKIAVVEGVIWRSIMDSIYLEDLQTAKTQDDFETSISNISREIVEAIAGEGLDLVTRRDVLKSKLDQLLKDALITHQRIAAIKKELENV